MAALDGAPGVKLRRPEFFFLRRMPADARGIKNHLRATERNRARAFRIPLVPAGCTPMRYAAFIKNEEAQVAEREIEFLVVERIVRDVHLAIFAGNEPSASITAQVL